VLYSWLACFEYPVSGLDTPQYNLTTIDKNGNATTVPTSTGATNGPSYYGCGPSFTSPPVQPVLQRADGSYIGTASTSEYVQGPMTAFTASGQQLWSQPNYTPQIATAGGGVIAASTSGSGQTVTFDQNGNQTGQMVNMTTRSWRGLAYQIGSVNQVVPAPTLLANSFWAVQNANQSTNYVAAPQTEYPQLVSCYAADNPPGATLPPCPGPRQTIWNAYKALAIANPNDGSPAVLVTNGSFIQEKVFAQLANGNANITESAFLDYLKKGFSPYDGTTSTAPKAILTAHPFWNRFLGNDAVSTNFLTADGKPDPSAFAATEPGVTPLTVFFNPYNFNKDTGGQINVPINKGANINNMAMLFHEGLHGFLNMDDPGLQTAFKCETVDQFNSLNLTDYLKQFLIVPPPQSITPCK